MLFQINYTIRPGSSAAQNQDSVKRALKLFSNWSPPPGMEVKSFYARADGAAGTIIAEANDAKVLLEGPAKFGTIFEYEMTPVLDISEAVPVYSEGADWVDQIIPPGF